MVILLVGKSKTYSNLEKTFRMDNNQGTLDEVRVMHDGLSVVGREHGDVRVSLQYVYQVPHIAHTNVPLLDKNTHGIMYYENITHMDYKHLECTRNNTEAANYRPLIKTVQQRMHLHRTGRQRV